MNRSEISKQLGKPQIDELKKDIGLFISFLQEQNDRTIVCLLEKLGKITNRLREPLLGLLDNNNSQIRYWTLKNLAKLKDVRLLDNFTRLAFQDNSSPVRRGAVSAIRKLKTEGAIPCLIDLLSDRDSSVVLQAIKGLAFFSENNEVKEKLLDVLEHPDEMVRDFARKEYIGSKNEEDDDHDKFPLVLKDLLVHGDAQEVLKYVPNDSVHLIFTSPPYYNARDYSIYTSYTEYLDFLKNVFKEAHRITKEGRFFVLNTSPVIIPRLTSGYASKRYPIPYDLHPILTKIGWEFVDDIVWVKPETSCKNRNGNFFQNRKPLVYKPNAITEMIMVYRKKTDKLIGWNINKYNNERVKKSKIGDGYETSNVWRINPVQDRVHSAVFPVELCDKIVRYYSFVGDLILDPFAGSGSLGMSAMSLGRSCFLIERESRYVDVITNRLSKQDSGFRSLELKSFKNETAATK